jgi:hypothetical protein
MVVAALSQSVGYGIVLGVGFLFAFGMVSGPTLCRGSLSLGMAAFAVN